MDSIRTGPKRGSPAITCCRRDVPILGAPAELSFVDDLLAQTKTFVVIVSVTEDIMNYVPHYEDTIRLLRTLAEARNDSGVRPLVLFTSGCKDYSMTGRAGSEGLEPHTEESPLDPPPFAVNRTHHAIKTFEHTDLFDAIALRPTTLYGLSGSFYGPCFDIAAEAAKRAFWSSPPTQRVSYMARMLMVAPRPMWRWQRIETGLQSKDNAAISPELDIISLKTSPTHFARSTTSRAAPSTSLRHQKVGLGRLRKDVRWSDKKQPFCQGINSYRLAYEATAAQNHGNLERIKAYIELGALPV